ncbi:hypothetical protein I4U23_007362 [Adineta vaga]|nr:hypothetical protein I4U23_007362 [Adineta vaga]
MSSSPTQDLLDRIDRLHVILASDIPTLSPTIPHRPTSILSRNPTNSIDLLTTRRISINTFHSTIKSESMIIDELQQYIQKLEREREILLRSYSIILQLLKHNDPNDKTNFLDYDDSDL